MYRLNSGNFRIFQIGESILNPHGSACKAFQIIQNDTKIDIVPWGFQLVNKLLNCCVGDYVGGHRGAKLSPRSKDALDDVLT